jgi:hypothetical protein
MVPCLLGDTFVIPSGTENREGGSGSTDPFLVGFDWRTEQIYSPNLFPALPQPEQGFRFTQVAFRFDAPGRFPGFDSATFDKIEIYMSTSAKAFPSGYTVDMDQNHGADKTLVFSSGIQIEGQIPAAGPAPFDIRFPFMSTYDYDPAKGDLVMEVRKYGSEALHVQTDAEQVAGVRLFTGRLDGSFVEAIGDVALVSQFSYSIVPEPTVEGILLLFTLAFFLKHCYRKAAAQCPYSPHC